MKTQVKAGSGGFLILVAAVAFLTFFVRPVRGADPTPQELLQNVRMNQGTQHRVLKGQLRFQDKVTPFRLVLNGNEIRYEFTKPDQIFVLKLGDTSSHFEEITKDGTAQVTRARFAEPVRGTDVTCEDLSLRFLYWQDAKFLTEDSIGAVKYCRIELRPDADSGSQYSKVVAWVAKKFDGVLGKAQCYAPDGKLAVQMRVISPMTLSDGTRFLGKMSIEKMEGGKSTGKDPTYLEILGEADPR